MTSRQRVQSATVRRTEAPAGPDGKLKRPASAYQSNNPDRTLHDPETFLKIKMQASAPYFQNNRVSTCSYVLKNKYGKCVAVQYPLEKTGWKHPQSYQNTQRSVETQSWSRQTFQKRQYDHLGMHKKPLSAYNPNAKRSTLAVPSVVMPYKNSSQMVIGDRASHKPRHFQAVNRMYQQIPDLRDATSNPGIIARRTLWTHRHQDLK